MSKKQPKIIPRGKFILVRPDDTKTYESENGVLMPGNVEQEKKAFGEVISVGSEIKDIKKGEKVVFMLLAGDVLEISNIKYILLHDDEVIAKMED